jgi:hypothetical protein
MNQILKQITKLILETKLPCTKCLPIALRITTAPRKDVELFPYEMLYGLPYLGRNADHSIMESKDHFLFVCFLQYWGLNSGPTP